VVEEAIVNANENLEINNITNVSFIQGKAEKAINSLIEEKVDTIVLDPPRSGVENAVLNAISKIKPKQIIYVSCNPVTLARDLKILCSKEYELLELTPFDMFPQTSHVETICLMSRIEKSNY
jgi:23S rRNA (uracil1939-C5)-methyltransferase